LGTRLLSPPDRMEHVESSEEAVLSVESITDIGSEEMLSTASVPSNPSVENFVTLPSVTCSSMSNVDSYFDLSLPSETASDHDPDADSFTDWSDLEGILSEDETLSDEDDSDVDVNHDVGPSEQSNPSEPLDDVFTTPLYRGAKMTIFDSFLLVLQFALR